VTPGLARRTVATGAGAAPLEPHNARSGKRRRRDGRDRCVLVSASRVGLPVIELGPPTQAPTLRIASLHSDLAAASREVVNRWWPRHPGVLPPVHPRSGVSTVETPYGVLRVAAQPLGTMGFDLDMRRVVEREHLGRGPVGLAPMSLQPLVASTPDLVRMTSASTTGRDERLVELRRLAELEVKQRR